MKVRGADDVGGGVRGGGKAPAARTRPSWLRLRLIMHFIHPATLAPTLTVDPSLTKLAASVQDDWDRLDYNTIIGKSKLVGI